MHLQVLHLTIIKHYIVEDKQRHVKSIRHIHVSR